MLREEIRMVSAEGLHPELSSVRLGTGIINSGTLSYRIWDSWYITKVKLLS
jgi:hypothetical protein